MTMRLHRNERVVPFEPSEHADMLAAIRPEDIVHYPDPDGAAALLAESTASAPDELTLFAGAESALRAVFDVAVEPGDAVVCLQPSYHGYVREAEAHRAELRLVAYRRLALDAEAVLAAVRDDARLVLLGNPDALGRPMPASLVRDVLARTGGLVVVDEAYHHFGAPAMHDLIGRHPRLVVLRSFSKAWGMAGVRCGYSIAAPEVAARLLGVRLRNEVSGPALALVTWALRCPAARDAHASEVARGARLLEAALRAADFEVVPTTANFVVARPPAGTSADEVRDLADKAEVAIAVVAGDLVRITAGPPAQMVPIIGALTHPAVGS